MYFSIIISTNSCRATDFQRTLYFLLTFANEGIRVTGRSPLFLDVSGTASLTLGAAGVVLTATLKFVRIVGICDVANTSVAVAHAPTSDTNILH